MKKRSGKNLIQWFYHFLVVLFMAMPLMSTLVRCLYVQFNHNAFENYGGYYEINYKYKSNVVLSADDVIINNVYELILDEFGIDDILTSSNESFSFILLTDLRFNTDYMSIDEPLIPPLFSANTIVHFTNASDLFIYVYNSIEQFLNYDYTISYLYPSYFLNNPIIQLISNHSENLYNFLRYTEFNEIESVDLTGTLDNAFDYSIEKTYNEYKDTTLVDFTSFFNNVFIDYTDNLYMNFATWYIGWVLSCAIVSFVPYVLLAFYHMAIHLIDRISFRKGD